MVSNRWLAILDRALRKPELVIDRVSTDSPRKILQCWVDLIMDLIRTRPQYTHEQRRAAAEVAWWNTLFDDRRCPQSPEEIDALVAANVSHFQSLPTNARQWRNIVRKALLSGHRVASLCQSWCDVRIELASDPVFRPLQQTVVFAYKAEILWFKLLFPREAFPGTAPTEWLEFELASETADRTRRYEEQKLLGATTVQLWLRRLPIGASSSVISPLNIVLSSGDGPRQASRLSSAQSSITLLAESHDHEAQNRPTLPSANNARKQPHSTRSEQRNPDEPLHPVLQSQDSSHNEPGNIERRNTAPWEDQGISADEWSVSFLNSAIRNSQQPIHKTDLQFAAPKHPAWRLNKRPYEDYREGQGQKRARLE